MNNKILRMVLVLGLAASCLFMSACTRDRKADDEPEIVVELRNDTWIMEQYLGSVQDYDHVVYEQVYADWGGRSIGPTESEFRGIIYLTEEEADRIRNAYEWEQTEAPKFEFGKVDSGSVGEGPWYSCEQFSKDNFKTVNVLYVVFDGEKIVFDIHQT